MTPSPGTIRRNAAAISSRRAMVAPSGVGISMVAPPRSSEATGSLRLGLSALARLEARIDLVDNVDAPLAPHDAAVLIALLQGLQRIGDLHDTGPWEGAEHRE